MTHPSDDAYLRTADSGIDNCPARHRPPDGHDEVSRGALRRGLDTRLIAPRSPLTPAVLPQASDESCGIRCNLAALIRSRCGDPALRSGTARELLIVDWSPPQHLWQIIEIAGGKSMHVVVRHHLHVGVLRI